MHNPIVIYFGLAYAIAWGGILAGENFLFSAIFAVVLWMVVAVVVATTGPRLCEGLAKHSHPSSGNAANYARWE